MFASSKVLLFLLFAYLQMFFSSFPFVFLFMFAFVLRRYPIRRTTTFFLDFGVRWEWVMHVIKQKREIITMYHYCMLVVQLFNIAFAYVGQ